MRANGGVLLITILLAAWLATAQADTPAPGAASAAPAQKVIKDADEYSAYLRALNTTDPAARAAAMEAFTAQYPHSVVYTDALEQAMAAWQQAGNTAKVEEVAGRILQAEQDNVRALAVVTAIKRNRATQGDKQALADLAGNAEHGLKLLLHWLKPAGVSDADFTKLHRQMEAIFYGAAGFSALQLKDYPKALGYYKKSVALDAGNLQDVYQLGIAELEKKPLDAEGFWYIARAADLAAAQGNAAGQQSIVKYGSAKYRKYHGGDDGWDAIVAAAQSATAPPADFAAGVKAAPTPAELAVQAVQQNDPAELSFSDYEYVLSYRDASPANKQAADKVWQAILAKQKNGKARLSMSVMVLAVSRDSLDAAITDDNQQAKKTDLHVKLAKPLSPPPAPGSLVQVVGVLTGYRPAPFAFQMEQGELAAPAAATH